MMPPSQSSTGTIDSGPVSPPPRRRLVLLAVAVVAAGVAVALFQLRADHDELPPPVAFTENWIAAWNDRDAQAVSGMTCDYNPAFVAAGIIQDLFDAVPEDRPVVGDHTITGTEPGVAFGREGTRVHVSFVPGARGGVQHADVFVRVREDGDMCIGYPVSW